MKRSQLFLEELVREAKATRALLEAVPFEKGDYKPHEKSMTLKRLTIHVAEITGWFKETLLQDELNFAEGDHTQKEYNTIEDVLALHDRLVENATKILNEVSDDEFDKMWTMRNGDYVILTESKAQVVRTWCFNHLFHHRGQLSVYLRMLDVKLPGTYGPTADM
ncbi:MAG: hypothetical protein KA264_05470 [Crocinitomicaceae bacterium]|nr:hypothetical protein [Crocinitomicaceae bacterium]